VRGVTGEEGADLASTPRPADQGRKLRRTPSRWSTNMPASSLNKGLTQIYFLMMDAHVAAVLLFSWGEFAKKADRQH